MKKKLLLLFVSVLLAISVPFGAAGCNKGSDGVTIWLRSFENWNETHYRAVLNKLNEDMPDGIKINFTFYTADTFGDALSAAQRNRIAPDIYQVSYQNLWAEYNNGTIKPVDEYIPAEALADLKDEAKNLVYYDGKYLAYPQLIEPSAVMYYNKEMLAAAGVTKNPATWTFQDLYNACDALLDKNVTPISAGKYPLAGFTPDQRLWSTMGLQYSLNGGLEPISSNWSSAALKTDGYRQFLRFFAELNRDGGKRIGGDDTPYNDHVGEIGKGKVALLFTGSWGIAELMETYPEMADKIGIAPIPTLDGNKETVTATNGGWAFVVDALSEKDEEVALVMKYLVSGMEAADSERIYSFFDAASFSKFIPRKSIQDMADARSKGAVPFEWIETIEDVAGRSIPEYIFSGGIKSEISKMVDKIKANPVNSNPDHAQFNNFINGLLDEATVEINRIIENDKLANTNPRA